MLTAFHYWQQLNTLMNTFDFLKVIQFLGISPIIEYELKKKILLEILWLSCLPEGDGTNLYSHYQCVSVLVSDCSQKHTGNSNCQHDGRAISCLNRPSLQRGNEGSSFCFPQKYQFVPFWSKREDWAHFHTLQRNQVPALLPATAERPAGEQ